MDALGTLFVQVLRLCREAGLVNLGTAALDSTKMLANASTGRSVLSPKQSEQYRQATVERLRPARAELAQEARQQLEAARAAQAAPHPAGNRSAPSDPQQREIEKSDQRNVRRAEQSLVQPTQQYNFVDPDSRAMRDSTRKCFVQAYDPSCP